MICAAIIPVGPGHERLAKEAAHSLELAWAMRVCGWDTLIVEMVDDTKGEKGRSAARNEGILAHPEADWYFLLDADDRAGMHTFNCFTPDKMEMHAVYGWPSFASSSGNRRVKDGPRTWQGILAAGPLDTITMGAFFKGESLRNHLFREDLDCAEDWELFLSFGAKHPMGVVKTTLCWVGYDKPSAGGPRGGERGWAAAADPFFRFWRKRGRKPLSDEERKEAYWLVPNTARG